MSIIENKLKSLAGQEIVVVMTDNRAFRGTLVEFDADTLIMRSVVEAVPTNAHGWEEPTATTAIVHKVITWKGVLNHEDTDAKIIRLKDVMIRTAGILRIWEWSAANVQEAVHVKNEFDAGTVRHGTRVTTRG